MVLGEGSLGLNDAAANVEPSGGLREEPGENDDQAGEHHLQPHWNEPLGVTGVAETTTGSSTGNQGADGPEDVVQTGRDTTMSRVGHLDDVGWAGRSDNADTETEEETTTHELADAVGADASSLNDNTDDDNKTCDEHAAASSPGINGGADERNGNNTADLIHRGDDTCSLVSLMNPAGEVKECKHLPVHAPALAT